MKKTIKLFFDFEFTSLSPDAQPISLGIVSEELKIYPDTFAGYDESYNNFIERCKSNLKGIVNNSSKSFYAEFSDFDLNRCDDWVKENVIGKLTIKDFVSAEEMVLNEEEGSVRHYGDTNVIRYYLEHWLKQFSGYNIQFVCDCGTFDWYWMLQLIGEWETVNVCGVLKGGTGICHVQNGNVEKCPMKSFLSELAKGDKFECIALWDDCKTGLPKLTENISPVPQDLNDLIAIKRGISAREAFDLNREELALGWCKNAERESVNQFKEDEMAFFGFPGENKDPKHNALWDARVIKAIYEKLN